MSSNSSTVPAEPSHQSVAHKIQSRYLHPLQRFLSPEWRLPINPYWLAVLSPLFGFVLRLIIDRWLGNQMPYITFLVAVALVGLLAGVGPALVSTGLGAAIGYWCFVPPRYRWGFQGISDAAGFISYLAAALGIVLLTGARKKAYAQAERRFKEQLTAQAKLRDVQNLFQLFMDNRPGFSYLRERDGQYVYFNNAARHLLGLNSPDTKLPEVISELQEQDEQALKSDTPLQFINKIDLPDGECYWLTTKFTFVNEEQRVFVGSVSTDITDQVKAEQLAVERERLIAASQMIATVAHEVNNPLAAVTSSVYLLGRETLPTHARDLVEIAQVELSRLGHITRLALGFYKDDEQPVAVDPCELVKHAHNTVVSRFSGAGPRIVYDFAWDGTIALPTRQVHEALKNILENSFQSSASQLQVRVRSSKDWRNFARSGCRISILDDGCGINPKHRKHAFEPFFSTKTQKGSGLGLWISKAIVLRNGGLISLRSTDDSARHGTCVSIFLPHRLSLRSRDISAYKAGSAKTAKGGLQSAAS